MLCSKCKIRPAVVFISRIENGKTINDGLCLICAKAAGVKPIDDFMKKMGISDDELDSISEQIGDLMGQDGDIDSFSPGGAAPFPFIQNIGNFMNNQNSNNDSDAQKTTQKEDKKEKEKKLSKNKYLDTYCLNLTKKATEGKIDRVIGRDEELYRVIQILNRRTKNNPCLIGEPGVGKTAIAEGLAIRIANKKAPARLLQKEVHLLDLTALIAGTQFRGQFESRVKGLVDEVKKLGNIILVIDEVHNLVGSGDVEGTMNAANMLKPALSRGEIQVIGATTLNEYRKHIEKDSALERRFQPVIINEPTIEDTISIIRGVKGYYEEHHNVKLPDNLIRQAVLMSERYVTDRFLPDKAIDLMDEACSNAGLNNKFADELFNLRIEIKEFNSKIEELETNSTDQTSFEEIAQMKADLCRKEERAKELQDYSDKVFVTDEDLARVIELWTGIPASKIKETEAGKLSMLDARIKEKIIGQDEAVALVTAAVKRARAGIVPRNRPISFIFTGPTGVGKTEFVKVLAKQLFDAPESLIRLDMSEFMEKHSVSRIIGSPPGYVGYDEAGQLTERIRRKPYSVVLFDEIEKAHHEVMNILLQILDEGKITDAHGKTVNFENTIIVMTSNAGSNIKGSSAGFNRTTEAIAKEKALKALSDFLRPEFLNRVDEVIVFSPLDMDKFIKIAELMLTELKDGLAEKGTTLSCTDDVLKYIGQKSFSIEYGARNIRRTVQKEIEDKLVEIVLNRAEDLKSVELSVENNEIVVVAK